jgi:prohibitin 2
MDNLGDRLRQLTAMAQKFGGDNYSSKGAGRGASGGLVAVLALAGLGFGIYKGIYSVDAGHRAIKFNKITGVKDTTYSEGYHLAIPFLERPIIYDVRTRANSITSLTGSKDLQMVNLSVRVLHRPDPNKLQKMYRELGLNYAERVLPSIGNEVLKSVVAQFTAAELLSKRKNVSDSIRKKLTERAEAFGVIVDDVSITDLAFGKDYSAAVEAKQVAKQEAERAKFLVQKALEEKKSMIVKAQGDAESIRLVSEALAKSQGFLELRRLEAAKDIADIISHSNNKVYLNSETLLTHLVGPLSATTKE